jgi:phosphopantothenoylcysteine decarboxylase/phosphopantothenate--cysteine ligase
MSVLRGKKIVLGISGGIAAYKTASLVRLFIKAGAEVQVIMTPASLDFVTPLTLATLSKRPVYSSYYNQPESEKQQDHPTWNNHVDLSLIHI